MVPYPPDVIGEIDKIVSHGKRTAFLVELARREIKLNRQRQALRAATGAWKAEDHPELAAGTAQWVREIRQESVTSTPAPYIGNGDDKDLLSRCQTSRSQL
jgi:hypothetical protein